MKIQIIPAKLYHAKAIHALVRDAAQEELMLPRPLGTIYELIRDFMVARDENGTIIGCCALHIAWETLAEIRSLAVAEEYRRHGIGKQLVEACLENACELGIPRIFALTYVPPFFIQCGFHEISKDELPHKIWSDCINCHKFPDCDEKAVAITLTETQGESNA